jgi:bacillithiol biosynthesis cysteine-adding enzyme BshC
MIKTQQIPYAQTTLLSNIIKDLVYESEQLTPFYTPFSLSNLKKQIQVKKNSFTIEKRKLLHAELVKQNEILTLSDKTKNNLDLLLNENSFTVTTGHQLNLFGGPLYFIYKIISVINFAKKLKKLQPEYNFIPVFWMATEDHDFEEINHFYFHNHKLTWKNKSTGAVGRLSTSGLNEIYQSFVKLTGDSNNAKKLQELFKSAYLSHKNLSDATRFFVNQLFKDEGLIIIDADNKNLKREFISIIKQDIFENSSFQLINKQSEELKKRYKKTQINARPINFFYLKDDLRERIEKSSNNTFKVLNTNIIFTQKELAYEIENYPERFSPNVALRPVYQETILPNLAYIGGGGEIAYWLQLKQTFETYNLPFPFIFLRNSAIWLDKKSTRYTEKLALNLSDIFLSADELSKKVLANKMPFSFNKYKQEIEKIIFDLEQDIISFDKSLQPSVLSSKTKLNNELKKLEKKVFRQLKRKETETQQKINYLHQVVFPNNVFQERVWNFSTLYLEYGHDFFTELLNEFKLPSKDILLLYPD